MERVNDVVRCVKSNYKVKREQEVLDNELLLSLNVNKFLFGKI